MKPETAPEAPEKRMEEENGMKLPEMLRVRIADCRMRLEMARALTAPPEEKATAEETEENE